MINGWIKKDGKYQLLTSCEQGLFVDGKNVCKKPSLFIVYLFEKYYFENKAKDFN